MTVSEIISQMQHKMGRTVESTRESFTKIRTGRASTGLLDHIMVDYYGSPTPLNQVAQLGVADARTLTVQPWEKKMVAVVEKAIRESDLGLNPATNGDVIRLPLPPLTEERRRELTKVVRSLGKTPRWLSATCVVMLTWLWNTSRRIRKLAKTKNVALRTKSRR